MHVRRRRRVLAPAIALCALALTVPAVLAQAPEPAKIADEVSEIVETPHPYPGGGPGLRPVWSHTFHYPEASYIAVHFDRFELAPGDVLVLRDPAGRYRHTYEGKGFKDLGGQFWGLSVIGDTMEVVLLSRNAEHDAYGVRIDRWAHGFPTDPLGPGIDALCGAEDFRDIECYASSYPEEYEKGRAAVRLIKNGSAHCTGWLASCDNHIITNEHCVGSQSELNSIEFQFEYKRPGCGTGTATVELQLQGGTLLETNAGLDYALIMPELAGNDPQSTYGYMQIDVRYPDPGEFMYIPGHPSGDPKRLSIESTHPNDPTGRCEVYSIDEPACTGGPVPDVGYFCDTEGGSSGSAVLSSETHKVIALHHCANCPNRGVPIIDVYNDIQASPNPLPACSTCEAGLPPADLVSSSPADNEVLLEWEVAPDAISYRIYRSDVGCDSELELVDETTDTTYLDTNVGGGITYYYRVVGVSDCGGESDYSNCTIVTPSGTCDAPPEFAGVELVETAREGSCGIDLSWSPARALCGSSRYNVYRSTVEGFEPGPGNLIERCVTLTRYTDRDVLPGVRYHYVVRAEDDAETGGGPCGGGNQDANVASLASRATGPDDVFYRNDFSDNAGWIMSGEWQIAPPRGLGGTGEGSVGNPDPNDALYGSQVLGTDLVGKGSAPGDYENGISSPQTAVSPPIDATGYDEVWVRFSRWLNVAAAPGDQAWVDACDGASCETLWANPSANLFDDRWATVDVDATELLAGSPGARIRFAIQSDSSVRASGWNVDRLELYQPTTCTTDALAVSPVPDGHLAPGDPMTAREDGPGSVAVSWDAERCPSLDYNLFYGDQTGLSSLSYTGEVCGLGAAGEATVAIPDPQPGGLVWWLVAGVEAGVEGIHGYDSAGSIRAASAGGRCDVSEQSAAGVCE